MHHRHTMQRNRQSPQHVEEWGLSMKWLSSLLEKFLDEPEISSLEYVKNLYFIKWNCCNCSKFEKGNQQNCKRRAEMHVNKEINSQLNHNTFQVTISNSYTEDDDRITIFFSSLVFGPAVMGYTTWSSPPQPGWRLNSITGLQYKYQETLVGDAKAKHKYRFCHSFSHTILNPKNWWKKKKWVGVNVSRQ